VKTSVELRRSNNLKTVQYALELLGNAVARVALFPSTQGKGSYLFSSVMGS
jgi:hypothetical protein